MSIINLMREYFAKRKNICIILLLIFCLSLSASVMHYMFVCITPENVVESFENQERQLYRPTGDGRILVSRIVAASYWVSCKILVNNHYYNKVLALLLAEFIFAFFSYLAMYMLSQKILEDQRWSLFATVAMAVFVPLGFQQASARYGEMLIFGLYAMLILLVINKRELLFLLVLCIASLQRPEVAISAVFFKIIYDYAYQKRIIKVIFNSILILIPFAILAGINRFYNINTVGYVASYTFISGRVIGNLKGIPLWLSVYTPLIFLAIFNLKNFPRILYLVLVTLIPYLLTITISGNYSEARLFFPFAAVFIIGLCYSIKNKGNFTIERLIL